MTQTILKSEADPVLVGERKPVLTGNNKRKTFRKRKRIASSKVVEGSSIGELDEVVKYENQETALLLNNQ